MEIYYVLSRSPQQISQNSYRKLTLASELSPQLQIPKVCIMLRNKLQGIEGACQEEQEAGTAWQKEGYLQFRSHVPQWQALVQVHLWESLVRRAKQSHRVCPGIMGFPGRSPSFSSSSHSKAYTGFGVQNRDTLPVLKELHFQKERKETRARGKMMVLESEYLSSESNSTTQELCVLEQVT